jgi:hypothetical protein
MVPENAFEKKSERSSLQKTRRKTIFEEPNNIGGSFENYTDLLNKKKYYDTLLSKIDLEQTILKSHTKSNKYTRYIQKSIKSLNKTQ